MQKNQKAYLLILAVCAVWGSIAATWHGGDNLDLWFVVVWSMVASIALMFTAWVMVWIAATLYHGEMIPVTAPIRPRNRRIR